MKKAIIISLCGAVVFYLMTFVVAFIAAATVVLITGAILPDSVHLTVLSISWFSLATYSIFFLTELKVSWSATAARVMFIYAPFIVGSYLARTMDTAWLLNIGLLASGFFLCWSVYVSQKKKKWK
jgi:hypothetical protein